MTLTLAWRNRVASTDDGRLTAAPLAPSAAWAVDGLAKIRTAARGESARVVDPERVGTRLTLTGVGGLVDLVALPWHSLAPGSLIRLCGWDAAGLVRLDTGLLEVWPRRPWGSLLFGEGSWWGHYPTDATDPADEWGGLWHWLADSALVLDRIELEIQPAPGQTAYVLPWLYVGPALRTAYSYDWGAVDGWAAGGSLQGIETGTPYGAAEVTPRVAKVTLSHLTEAEAMAGLWDLVRYAGQGKAPFLAIFRDEDQFLSVRRSMVAFFSTLPDLERASRGRRRSSMEFTEWLI